MARVDVSEATIDLAIRYAGSEAGVWAREQLRQAIRELHQLRELHGPFAVTSDEMAQAWSNTHDRADQESTREHLNAILANRRPTTQRGRDER